MPHLPFKTIWAKAFLLVVSFAAVFYQAGRAGGDHYEIYLNKKLVLKQHVGQLSAALMNLELETAKENDLLSIYYSHCGVTGKGRKIGIKNTQNQILKEWKFADAKGADRFMTINVKDIIRLKKNNPDTKLKLYYSSAEQLPEGRMLAAIRMDGKQMTQQQSDINFPSVFTAGDVK